MILPRVGIVKEYLIDSILSGTVVAHSGVSMSTHSEGRQNGGNLLLNRLEGEGDERREEERKRQGERRTGWLKKRKL